MPLSNPLQLRSRRKNRKANQYKNADELAQGVTLLQAKKFMTKQVGKNYKLMEGFAGGIIEDPVYTNNQVPSMPGPGYTGPMPEIQSPVTDINQQEMEELKTMENEFQQTLSQWGQLHTSVVGSLTNLPATYSACIEACGSPTTSDVDLVNACKYGCNIGKYTGQDNTAREKSGNMPESVAQFNPNPSRTAVAAGPIYQSSLTQLENASQVNPTMTQSELSNLWQTFYAEACSAAIGGDSGISATDKRRRYCSGWQGTQGGTSGFWGNGRAGDFISMGSAASCDTPIGADKSGYCVCLNGRKVGYADNGHPSFTCNDLCAPQNKNMAGIGSASEAGQPDQPLYNNPSNWSGPKTCPPCGHLEKHWSKSEQEEFCASFGEGCCKFTDHAVTNTCTSTGETSHCTDPYCPTRPGGGTPAAQYINALPVEPLPTTSQLIQQCEDQMAAFGTPELGPTFGTLYSDILALGQLEQKMEQQAEAIYTKIKSSSNTRNQVALANTSAGQRLLKHLDTYETIYRRLHVTEQKELNMVARAEDETSKTRSGQITYIIWFTLAISSMFLIIKFLRK